MGENSAYVYLIAKSDKGVAASPVKVGISGGDPNTRMGSIRTACPFRIDLVHWFTVPDRHIAREIERAFHGMQKQFRAHGEWFNIEPKLALMKLVILIEFTLDAFTTLTEEEREFVRQLNGVNAAMEGEYYGALRINGDKP